MKQAEMNNSEIRVGRRIVLMSLIACIAFSWTANRGHANAVICGGENFAKLGPLQMRRHLVHFKILEPPCCDRNLRLSGVVDVRVAFDQRGKVVCVQVLKGHPLAASAAMEAARQWKFSPYLLRGSPKPAYGDVEVEYTFKDGEGTSQIH